MQHVFQYHHRTHLQVCFCSLVQQYNDKMNLDSPEVKAIRQGTETFVELKYSASSSSEHITQMVSRIQQDE
jgi:hypothetical protein